jgi:hypothetical protein
MSVVSVLFGSSFLQLHPDFENWTDVSFLEFVGEIAPWVRVWTTVASMASNVGLLNAGFSTHSRAIWALAGGDATSLMPCRHFPSVLGVTWKRTRTIHAFVAFTASWVFTTCCWYITGYGTPVPALVLCAVGVAGLSFYSFETLVGADMLLTVRWSSLAHLCVSMSALLHGIASILQAVRLYIEFASFLWLRRKWPDVPRGYKFPWGWPGAWLITIPKLAVILMVTVTAHAFSWYTFAAVNGQ